MERLSSHDYANVAAVVVRKIHDSVACQALVSPPFEVHITGGIEDDFVLCLSVAQDGEITGSTGQDLLASFPLTVTITDRLANVVKMMIGPPGFVQ
jgi:hypothetical protein